MSSILTTKIKEDFYIRLYFNLGNGFENAGLKRAYLDFNRTLKIKDGNQENRDRIQKETQGNLKSELLALISKDLVSQEDFDIQHKSVCLNLTSQWPELTIGQSQKWINMTLKYWLLFGKERIANIEKNEKYFHIPIDSYVQYGMFPKIKSVPWSKIDDYEIYFNYQLNHRSKKTGNPPILDEFLFFIHYKKT